MRRKHIFFSLAAVITLLLSNVAVSAQTGQLAGEVMMTQADGKTVPAVGATIDVYRTDLPGHYPNKTDKKGQFRYAGLPFVGEYIIVASAPNTRADVKAGAKAGRDNTYRLMLMPGDGKRPTAEEAKSIANSAKPSDGGSESAEDRKKREEMLAKNAEIDAGNKKIEASNVVVTRTFKLGNEAFEAKRWDDAIAQYDEGINADQAHPGVPILMRNKALSHTKRGIDRYNAALQLKEAAQVSAAQTSRKDFGDSLDATTKALDFIKAHPAESAAQAKQTSDKLLILRTRVEAARLLIKAMKLSREEITQPTVDAVLTAYQEYLATEANSGEKLKVQLEAGETLLDAMKGDMAFAEFQKALTLEPENVDALAGAGLSLFNTGEKAKFQEAANYLQRFVDKAPDTHKLKASAKEALEYFKSQENIKPQKPTTTGGRRRG